MSRLRIVLSLFLAVTLWHTAAMLPAQEVATDSPEAPAEEAAIPEVPPTEAAEGDQADSGADPEAEESDSQESDEEDSEEGASDEPVEPEPGPGQDDLDKATRMKMTAKDGKQINDVIQLLAAAMKKGLDEENEAFAKQMLASTLMERGQGLARVLLQQPLPNPSRDPRWLQLRRIAMSDLAGAVKLDPAELEAWILIGKLQQLPQGDAKAALAAYTKVIESKKAKPKLKAEAYARRSTTQAKDKAKLADMAGAIKAESGNVTYRLLRARHYLAAKDYRKALSDVDDALELSPEEYASHELRGLVLRGLGRTEEAFKALDRAGEIKPDAIMPYLQRSEMHGQLGDMDQAIEQASKAIDRDDANALGYLLRAELYLRNKQVEEALVDADKVLEISPNYAPAILLKARAFEEGGETHKALEQLEALAAAVPAQADLNMQIALYALKLEMPRRAVAALDRAIQVKPDDATLHRFRGDAHLNMGAHAEAVGDYERAQEIEPEDSGILNNLAWTLATSPDDEVRDGKRAVKIAIKACELTDYETPHILSTLAAAHAETGDFEKAKEFAKKAVELNDGENQDQIAEELANYERGEPTRELQQLDSGERDGAEPKTEEKELPRAKLEKPSGSTPAPRRSIDF